MSTNHTLLIALLAAMIGLSSCASSAPQAVFTEAPTTPLRIDDNDSIVLTVEAANEVPITEGGKTRLQALIRQELEIAQASTTDSNGALSYTVNVTVTRYDKGNAFARAMLAGLGQIHIEARVSVLDSKTDEPFANFTVSKTFAWGGLYGAGTTIETVEPAFAEGVAAALTGKTEQEPSNTDRRRPGRR